MLFDKRADVMYKDTEINYQGDDWEEVAVRIFSQRVGGRCKPMRSRKANTSREPRAEQCDIRLH